MGVSQLTIPAITFAQNTADAQRLIAAQAVLYTRSKRARNLRIMVVLAASVILAIAAAASDDADIPVGIVGGIVVLAVSLWARHHQQSMTDRAVAVQERFDTRVFQLDWNTACLPRFPTTQEVAAAAAKYTGNRTSDWYPPTPGVHRPLDVLICQLSNLGWGSSVHRRWAGLVVLVALGAIIGLVATWWVVGLDGFDGINILLLPAVPVFWEATDEVISHWDSAKRKEEAQQTALVLWQFALSSAASLPEGRCREIQTEIVHIRQINAQVPDWFDELLRPSSERSMRVGAADMVEEARRNNKA